MLNLNNVKPVFFCGHRASGGGVYMVFLISIHRYLLTLMKANFSTYFIHSQKLKILLTSKKLIT